MSRIIIPPSFFPPTQNVSVAADIFSFLFSKELISKGHDTILNVLYSFQFISTIGF